MTLKTTRRRVLELAAAVPALSFLRRIDARAAGVEGPPAKRFMLIYHAMGTSGAHWYGNASEQNFQLGYTLSPLSPHKNDLVLVRNVNNEPACEYWHNAPSYCPVRGGKVDQHSSATCTLLSPARPRNPNEGFTFPGMETLDWHIGRQLKAKANVPHGHLYLTPARRHGADIDGVDVFSSRRNAGGQMEDPYAEDNPVEVYKKYMAGQSGQVVDLPGDKVASDRMQRRKLARRLVTDFVAKEVVAFQKELPSSFKSEVDPHMQELRELEKTLTDVEGDPSKTPTEKMLCSSVEAPENSLHVNTTTNYRARAEVMADIAVSAFACDITRSMTYSFWTFNGRCLPPNLAGTKRYGNLHEGLQHGRHGYTRQDVADCHQHVAHQVSRMIGKLKAIPEGDGTMLDNTLILWISDMGMDPFDSGSSHNKRDLPFLLAGKAGGALKTNRFIDVKGMSHARLFSAVTHLMGMPQDVFGEAKYNQGGPAQQLLAR